MIKPSKQQYNNRWDTLPDALREALVSEEYSNFVWKTCEDRNVAEKNIRAIAADVSWVLMGFLHIDDLAAAFQADAGIDAKTAAAIKDEFDKKIFASFGETLEKIYQLATPTPTTKTMAVPAGVMSDAPKILDVTSPKTPPAVPPPAPKPDLASKGWSGMQTVAGPQSIKISDAKPVSFANIPTPAPMPTATTAAPMVAPKPTSTAIPQPQNIPQPPQASPIEAAPVILKGTNFSSAPQKNADFRLPKSGNGAQVEFGQSKPQVKTMPAFIEFSKSTQKPGASPVPAPAPTAPTQTKGAIHYTEFTPSAGPRSVTEITSSAQPSPAPAPMPSIPKPPAPPKPMASVIPTPPLPPKPPVATMNPPISSSLPTPVMPPVPQPPQPPMPQAKVITKDFL